MSPGPPASPSLTQTCLSQFTIIYIFFLFQVVSMWDTIIVCLVSVVVTAKAVVVTVDTSKAVEVVSERFLSFTVDPSYLMSGTSLR